MNTNLKCDKCGREAHEDHFAIDGGKVVCEWCREKDAPRPKFPGLISSTLIGLTPGYQNPDADYHVSATCSVCGRKGCDPDDITVIGKDIFACCDECVSQAGIRIEEWLRDHGYKFSQSTLDYYREMGGVA